MQGIQSDQHFDRCTLLLQEKGVVEIATVRIGCYAPLNDHLALNRGDLALMEGVECSNGCGG